MRSLITGMIVVAGLGAAAAHAEPFALVVREAPAEFAKRDRSDAVGAEYWKAYTVFGEQLQAAGVLRGGSPLGVQLASLRVVAGQPSATEAGRAEAGLVLGGFFLIDVRDLVAAKEWAARAPAALSGRVDIHRVPASPAMQTAK